MAFFKNKGKKYNRKYYSKRYGSLIQEFSKQVNSANKIAIFKTTCDSLPTYSMIPVHSNRSFVVV